MSLWTLPSNYFFRRAVRSFFMRSLLLSEIIMHIAPRHSQTSPHLFLFISPYQHTCLKNHRAFTNCLLSCIDLYMRRDARGTGKAPLKLAEGRRRCMKCQDVFLRSATRRKNRLWLASRALMQCSLIALNVVTEL